jgi:hypothetical protein
VKETTVSTPSATAKVPGKRGRPKGVAVVPRNVGEGASTEARRLAAAILEVLAGTRTPTTAAQTLSISLPRYYALELRALQGMLVACEPRQIGRAPSTESALAALRRECEQLRRDCARQQTLLRAAQRSLGLAPPAPPPRTPVANGKKRRPRRPTARALRIAARLQEATPTTTAPAPNGAAANP